MAMTGRWRLGEAPSTTKAGEATALRSDLRKEEAGRSYVATQGRKIDVLLTRLRRGST
jgi:hypothetical protein